MKTTVVIGASTNPSRYANLAIHRLRGHDHPVRALGIREGKIGDVEIELGKPVIDDVDTVTLYVGPGIQREWEDYIKNLKPRRVIFNPGTENEAFESELQSKGIETLQACTLVMLSTGQY